MRITVTLLACTLVLVASISPLALALGTGPSASGKFEIVPNEGTPGRSIEFNAETTADGQIFGAAVFQDLNATSDEPDELESTQKPLYLRAEFDCLVVKENKAVMSGSITQASRENYLGRRFVLVVQDNGASENPRKRDRVTWGVYRSVGRDWLVTDAERPDEIGPISWLATDAERPDDPGLFPNLTQTVGCQTFPLSSFSFLGAAYSRGTVRVRP